MSSYLTDERDRLSKKEHEEYMSLTAKPLETHVPSVSGELSDTYVAMYWKKKEEN